MELMDSRWSRSWVHGGASGHRVWPAISVSLFSVLANSQGAEISYVHETANNPARTWSIGHLLPRLMLLFFVLDLVLRFVPLDPLAFRAGRRCFVTIPTRSARSSPTSTTTATIPTVASPGSETFLLFVTTILSTSPQTPSVFTIRPRQPSQIPSAS